MIEQFTVQKLSDIVTGFVASVTEHRAWCRYMIPNKFQRTFYESEITNCFGHAFIRFMVLLRSLGLCY